MTLTEVDAAPAEGFDASSNAGTAWFDNLSPGLEHAWHAVATVQELDAAGVRPVPVVLLGRGWVLARLDGRVVALADRCPHRLAPLRIGTVCGATLQCAYHGWRFGADGRCADIPALGPDATIPARAAVETAQVVERFGLVWMCVGDPVAPLPVIVEWDDPAFDVGIHQPRHTTVSVGQLVDNFLDATHLPLVHAGTFGVTDDPVVPPFDVVRDGWQASTECTLPYKNADDPLVATGEHPLVQPQVLFKQVLGPSTALVRIGFPMTGRTIVFLFACTPETRERTRLFKLMARDDFGGDAARMAEALEFEDRVLDEDLVVLEAYDEMGLALDLRTEVHTRADKLSVAYRRLLADLVATADGGG